MQGRAFQNEWILGLTSLVLFMFVEQRCFRTSVSDVGPKVSDNELIFAPIIL